MKNSDTPAYPTNAANGIYYEGLTKREAFAMAAMQSCINGLASPAFPLSKIYTISPEKLAEITAALSLTFADALLDALEEKR